MNKLLPYILRSFFLGALIVYSFIYLRSNSIPELQFHIQQPPFMALKSFFYSYLSYPSGLAEYIATFVSQFFFFGWPGAILILFVLFLLSFFLFLLIRKYLNTDLSIFGAALPSILAFNLFNNYYFTFAVIIKLLIVSIALWVLTLLYSKTIIQWISTSILSTIVYYIAGSGSYLLFAVSAILLNICYLGIKRSLKINIFLFVISILIPYILFKRVFNTSLEDAYFKFIPDLPKMIRYKPSYLFYTVELSVPLIFLVVLGMKQIAKKFKPVFVNSFRWIQFIVLITISFGILITLNSYTYNKQKHSVALTQYYNCTEQWQEVINTAHDAKQYDISINYYYNRAIDKKGEFLTGFFDYPQLIGVDGLYFDKIVLGEISALSSDYYFDLGYISESEHWAYELLTSMPYSLHGLKREVINNLIIGNFAGAEKFLNILSNNFLASQFVEKYRPYVIDTTRSSRDSMIVEKRNQIPTVPIVPDNIILKFENLVTKNPKNKCAYEHLLMSYLLTHNVAAFMEHFEEGTKFYSSIPLTYQLAVIVYVMKYKPSKLPKIELSEEAKRIFNEFNKILKEYKGDKNNAVTSMAEFCSKTYLYYMLYESPVVTKSEMQIREENYAQN